MRATSVRSTTTMKAASTTAAAVTTTATVLGERKTGCESETEKSSKCDEGPTKTESVHNLYLPYSFLSKCGSALQSELQSEEARYEPSALLINEILMQCTGLHIVELHIVTSAVTSAEAVTSGDTADQAHARLLDGLLSDPRIPHLEYSMARDVVREA